jgi:putative transposase
MARPLRIEFPGALYHVTSRGNAGQAVFLDGGDRERLIAALAEVARRLRWLCHAYCLMGNHFHLLLETPRPNLSNGMQQIGTLYAQGFNRRYDRQGHVFQGRFKAILVERESHLLEVSRYVVLNPVRAGLTRWPEEYRWSSYRATVGLEPRPDWLSSDWVLAQFGASRRVAALRYRGFVRAGIWRDSPWSGLRGQVVLGGDAFLEALEPYFEEKLDARDVPHRQRAAPRPTLEAIFRAAADTRRGRDAAAREAYEGCGYSLAEIGRHLGRHYTTIKKAVERARARSDDSRPDPIRIASGEKLMVQDLTPTIPTIRGGG